MSFRTAYGNSYSENGWRMCNRDECDDGVVPGTGLRLPIRRGVANIILKGWCSYFNAHVETLNNPRGYSDEGSWTPTNDVSTSNHLSGTAVDLNWSEHAFRVSYSGFTQGEITKCRAALKLFEGTIWWGQDWVSPKDAMHFQLNFREGDPRNAAFASKLSAGYLGIWGASTTPIPTPPPPAGGRRLLQVGVSGEDVGRLQAAMNKVFPRYSRLVVDGDFGPATEAVVKDFQHRAGLLADGIVGDNTYAALAKFGIKL